MERRSKQKKIAIILAIILSIQIPLLILYMIYSLNFSVVASIIGGIVSFVIASIAISIIYFYKVPETEYQDKNSLFKNLFKSLEKPWLRRQVETHLIFGPISKYIKLSWLSIMLIISYFFFGFTRTSDSFSSYSFSFFKIWWFVVLILYIFSGIPKYKQAALGWFIGKGACLIIVLLFAIAGICFDNTDTPSPLLPIIILLLLWIPFFEFIPKITPHQKFITLARIILSYALFQF